MSREPSAAEKMIGDFAPKLVQLTDQVLFGDVWERPELSKRDRSLATVAALIALNRPEQLRFRLNKAPESRTLGRPFHVECRKQEARGGRQSGAGWTDMISRSSR